MHKFYTLLLNLRGVLLFYLDNPFAGIRGIFHESEMNEEKEEEKKHNACESERRGTVSRVDTVYQLMGERNRERFKRLNAGRTRKHFHKYLGVMNLVKAAVPQGKT